MCSIQLALLLPVVSVLVIVSKVIAYSALLGGVLFILPNAYFTAYAFRYCGSAQAARIVRAFYWGEAGKLVLTMVGFALAFRFVTPLHVPAMIGGYCLMIVSQWLIAARLAKRMAN